MKLLLLKHSSINVKVWGYLVQQFSERPGTRKTDIETHSSDDSGNPIPRSQCHAFSISVFLDLGLSRSRSFSVSVISVFLDLGLSRCRSSRSRSFSISVFLDLSRSRSFSISVFLDVDLSRSRSFSISVFLDLGLSRSFSISVFHKMFVPGPHIVNPTLVASVVSALDSAQELSSISKESRKC